MFGRLGFTEILVICGVALLLFGGSRISEIGKGLGEGIRNFKKGIREDDDPARAEKSDKTADPARDASETKKQA